jgi:hypothetical protein
MHVSSQKSPVARHWTQKLYLGVASLILIGIVSEGLLIGPSLFATTHWGRAVHGYIGVLLLLLALLLPVAGRLARQSSRMIILSAVLPVLTLIEVTSAVLGKRTPLLAAIHPANALLMIGLTVLLLIQEQHLMRERRDEMIPSLDQ